MKTTYTYQILPPDLDAHRRFRMVSMERILLNVAGLDADAKNFGAFHLIDDGGVSWVLLKLAIAFEKLPGESDLLNIETWVEEAGRLLTTRNFRVTAPDGSLVCQANSQWTVLNIETRKPVNLLSTHIQDFITAESVPAAVKGKIESLQTPLKSTHRVSYSDLDYNDHTNSIKYLEWIVDSYPVEEIYNRTPDLLEIVYMREATYGELVEICYEDCAPQTIFNIKAPDGSGDYVRARITWK
ncbi:MAG: hypothetical protein HUJ91_03335 [Bacteroidales bacterium]|nr:hypothetical protein [Bacteroidales bacterium]